MTFKEKLLGCKIDIHMLSGMTFMITGVTGLIGKIFAIDLLRLSEDERLGIKLILLVRNKNKLDDYLLKQEELGNVIIIEGDISDFHGNCPRADYVVHCASITESQMMVNNPVEVILTNIYGTVNMLEYARNNSVKAFVYLSSMEIYGFSLEETVLSEDKIQYLNPLEIRSCYPESKRMAENICVSYASEYGVPTRIVRLAQTFGKGVNYNDKRVFAEFARCAIKKKDIVLLTDGSSKRMYLDVEDAITAIITVLLKGSNRQAYNVANPKTYCSISQMASIVAESIGKGKINVKKAIPDGGASQFPPSHKFYLDTTNIEQIGWVPYNDLIGMYNNMLLDWENHS